MYFFFTIWSKSCMEFIEFDPTPHPKSATRNMFDVEERVSTSRFFVIASSIFLVTIFADNLCKIGLILIKHWIQLRLNEFFFFFMTKYNTVHYTYNRCEFNRIIMWLWKFYIVIFEESEHTINRSRIDPDLYRFESKYLVGGVVGVAISSMTTDNLCRWILWYLIIVLLYEWIGHQSCHSLR